jgi:Immunoglobulin-like domain of bacterial spore germination
MKQALFLLATACILSSCSRTVEVSSFEECKNAGYNVYETYPMQCRTPDGLVFAQVINQDSSAAAYESDHLVLFNVEAGEVLTSRIITGKARLLFFEGTFPVTVYNDTMTPVVETVATAQSDWMTEDWVNFTIDLQLPENLQGRGIIEFKRDNPSGDPANDVVIPVPVLFQ